MFHRRGLGAHGSTTSERFTDGGPRRPRPWFGNTIRFCFIVFSLSYYQQWQLKYAHARLAAFFDLAKIATSSALFK